MDTEFGNSRIYKLVSKDTKQVYIGTSKRDIKDILLSLKSGSERKQKQGSSMTKAESFYSLGKCNIYLLQVGLSREKAKIRKKFYKKKYKNVYI